MDVSLEQPFVIMVENISEKPIKSAKHMYVSPGVESPSVIVNIPPDTTEDEFEKEKEDEHIELGRHINVKEEDDDRLQKD